jgi:hypothetical protein
MTERASTYDYVVIGSGPRCRGLCRRWGPRSAAPALRHAPGHGKLTRAPKSFAHDLGRVTGREPAKSPQDELIARLGIPIGVV